MRTSRHQTPCSARLDRKSAGGWSRLKYLLALPLLATTAQAGLTTPAAAQGTHVLVNASEIRWGNAPPSLPPGATAAVIEGNPAEAGPFTLRLRLPDGYRIMPHSHPAVEHVTVLSGTFLIGAGETVDLARAKQLTAGGFMAMPAQAVHYAGARGETVIQLHGIGPWAINYVNPADDPRR